MLALGSSQQGFFEGAGMREFSVLGRSLAMELQGWCIRRLRKELIEERGLTLEDLQLLAFERAGLGTKQIASDLGISTTAIDSRWKRLNQKMGMPNRKASASLATEYGVI
jgi:DNA-binding NarL/FixJ family response regulator